MVWFLGLRVDFSFFVVGTRCLLKTNQPTPRVPCCSSVALLELIMGLAVTPTERLATTICAAFLEETVASAADIGSYCSFYVKQLLLGSVTPRLNLCACLRVFRLCSSVLAFCLPRLGLALSAPFHAWSYGGGGPVEVGDGG